MKNENEKNMENEKLKIKYERHISLEAAGSSI